METSYASSLPIADHYGPLNKKTVRPVKALVKRFCSYAIICVLIILASQEMTLSQLPTPSPGKPSSEEVLRERINELIETVKKDLTASQNTLREAQDLLITSKRTPLQHEKS